MALDADTVTVDGVEPSIPVKLLDVKGNPDQVKIFSDDNGTYRYLVKGEDPILLTPQDLAALVGVEVEISKGDHNVPVTAEHPEAAQISTPDTVVIPAGKPAQEPFSPINPPVSSGQ
jgi:hypothetical protein